MTAADLISRIRREVQTDLPDGELLEYLNAQQHECAVDLKVPTMTIEVSGVTGDFTLPEGTQYNALLSAQNEYGHTIELMTVASANDLFPGWTRTDFSGARPFALIYDPANISAPVRPLPSPPATSTFRLTVALRPVDMVELSDEPFTVIRTDGVRSVEMADAHNMLVYGVVASLHLRAGDARASAYYGRYEQLKDMAWRDTRPSPQRMRRHESHFRRRSWR
jgi:hypothetical protein